MLHPRVWSWDYLLGLVCILGGSLGLTDAPYWLDIGLVVLGFVAGVWVDHRSRYW